MFANAQILIVDAVATTYYALPRYIVPGCQTTVGYERAGGTPEKAVLFGQTDGEAATRVLAAVAPGPGVV
jgi:hypothetical protein